MSAYALQKAIREVNRNPAAREAFFADRAGYAAGYDLRADERDALATNDITALYRLGVHGLILRPFTLLQQMPEPEYLAAIRKEG
jgi:hypothetical protein